MVSNMICIKSEDVSDIELEQVKTEYQYESQRMSERGERKRVQE